jgi:2-amino-4-hydroxy-6-hydroxymethyldihydropteridine diphosphokinase
MATALIALGSNLGDREATLRSAVVEMNALPLTRVMRESRLYEFAPIGGPSGQANFLNAAGLLETRLPPGELLSELQQIESRHGRQRDQRWSPRTLDLDLLLYGDRVIDTPTLVVPHSRMSFRRFVLAPAAEIAPELLHPTIGWSLGQLALHLELARDWAVIVSPSAGARRELSELAITRHAGIAIERPRVCTGPQFEGLWPVGNSSWLSFPQRPNHGRSNAEQHVEASYPRANLPKLTILVDDRAVSVRDPADRWQGVQETTGRGPTLNIVGMGGGEAAEAFSAAVETVWPHLGQNDMTRIK